MKHRGVHVNLFKPVRVFQIELEFESVSFWEEGKSRVPGEKPLEARERTSNKLNPHMASTAPGVEPGPHWWEASDLTTAPPLLPWRGDWVHIQGKALNKIIVWLLISGHINLSRFKLLTSPAGELHLWVSLSLEYTWNFTWLVRIRTSDEHFMLNHWNKTLKWNCQNKFQWM